MSEPIEVVKTYRVQYRGKPNKKTTYHVDGKMVTFTEAKQTFSPPKQGIHQSPEEFELAIKVMLDKPIQPGRHGIFTNLELAEEGVIKCMRHFNELIIQEAYTVDNVRKPVIAAMFDRVDVWIDNYENGKLVQSGEEKCPEPESTAAPESSGTSSMVKKSRKKSTTNEPQAAAAE